MEQQPQTAKYPLVGEDGSDLGLHQMNADLIARLKSTRPRSMWHRGVLSYAAEMAESAEVALTPDNCEHALLNGARDWREASYGGSYECYDRDIAARLCPPAELLRKKNGSRTPNGRESWLGVQARALYQAALIVRALLS